MSPKAIGKTFLRGLAAVLPVAVTLYVLWWLATTAEATLGGIARAALRATIGEDWYVPGTGVVLGLVLVFAAGVVARAVLVRRLAGWFEDLLERIPLVKSIYGPLRDLMGFVASGESEERFNQAVRVDFDDQRASMLGLVTREDAAPVSKIDGDDRVVVYLPMSYQIGGYMLVIPRERVTEIDLSVEDVMRTTLTAGMSIGGETERESDDDDA